MKTKFALRTDSFCGKTFKSSKGGTMTVVGILDREQKYGVSTKFYAVTCSICHGDSEMYEHYFETRKQLLEKGICPCACSKNYKHSTSEKTVFLNRFIEENKFPDLFTCFDNPEKQYKNNRGRIKLFCLTHMKSYTKNYQCYVYNGHRCSECNKDSKKNKL